MSCLAIITARGGSKRIPHKNIKDFCGRPIIEYSIEAALNSELFDEVMVSTDSEAIAQIAIKAGAKVPFFRSADTSSDHATTSDVLVEVLDRYQSVGKKFDYFACLYPTAPFITPDKLVKGFEILKREKVAMVLPVVQFSFPPQRGLIENGGNWEYKWPQFRNTRSQDLEKIYHDAGQFYLYDTYKFLDVKGQVERDIFPIIVSELEVQDIDNLTDWEIAEMKYQLVNN